MRTHILGLCTLVAVMLSFGCVALAENKPDKQAEGIGLLKRAAELTNITEQPYHLRYSIKGYDPVLGKVQGTISLFHPSSHTFKKEIHVTGYDEVTVVKDGQLYRVRKLPFTPAIVRTEPYSQLFRFLSELKNVQVSKISDRKVSDQAARCVTLKLGRNTTESTWCLSQTGLPIAHLTGESTVGFLNYVQLGNRQIPSEIRSSGRNGVNEVRLLDSGTQLPGEEALFVPPAGATSQPWCEDMTRPMPTSTPDPEYSEEARRQGLQGTVTYAVSIGAEGAVREIFPVRTHQALDKNAQRALQKWRFKPAMCGTTPVPTDILVEINFNMGWR